MEKRYVYAVRIFLKDGYLNMAELALGDGGRPNGETVTVRWDIPAERDNYIINAYTLMFDERFHDVYPTFDSYVHWDNKEENVVNNDSTLYKECSPEECDCCDLKDLCGGYSNY